MINAESLKELKDDEEDDFNEEFEVLNKTSLTQIPWKLRVI